MPSPRQKALVLLAAGLVLTAGIVAAAIALEPVEPSVAEPEDDAHDMAADERCAHMPEHCEEGARRAP